MSLEHAILGFLNYKPQSGYDLKKVFDTSVSHFWPADQSQIYRTLARLTEKGWAEIEVVEQTERPDRKVYHITEAGRAELRAWLAGPLPLEEVRSAPLVQIFFAGQLSDAELAGKFEEAAAGVRALLEHYRQLPRQLDGYFDMVHSPREIFFGLLTLEFGTKVTELHLAWLENVIERIRNQEYQKEK